MTDFPGLLKTLIHGKVEFIIVGGFAGTLHGSSLPTRDLDVVCSRRSDNVERLVAALAAYRPYPRGAPPDQPFRWDTHTVNFTLLTDQGALDLRGEIAGGGTFEDLRPHAETVTLFGNQCLCLGLRKLIEVKRAAGRERDLLAIADLEALLEERDRRT